MTTPAYRDFLDKIENPLREIKNNPDSLTSPSFKDGSIRQQADKLRKGIGNDALPVVMAAYSDDTIVDQKQQPAMNRMAKKSFTLSNTRAVMVYGIVSSLKDGDLPGDYIKQIDELLHDVKRALSSSDLKFIEVAYILDNDSDSLGLAGFALKITYKFTENFEYD